eukprot:1161296-Pelagomonas_calceolata.AAC.11
MGLPRPWVRLRTKEFFKTRLVPPISPSVAASLGALEHMRPRGLGALQHGCSSAKALLVVRSCKST